MEDFNRVEIAYAKFKKVYGDQQEGHPSTLDIDEAWSLAEMARQSAKEECDVIYHAIRYAFGAGYMLGFGEGIKQ